MSFIEREEYREVKVESGMGQWPANAAWRRLQRRPQKNSFLHNNYTRQDSKNPPAMEKTVKKEGPL